jgi:hypothetical protein
MLCGSLDRRKNAHPNSPPTPGHYANPYTGSYSYLDDFETSTSNIDLHSPYAWTLASTPFNNTSTGLFPEAGLSDNIDYGKNRAQLAWFYIDGIFTRKNSSLTPAYLKNDLEQLSNHLVREVYEVKLHEREMLWRSQFQVLNLSFSNDADTICAPTDGKDIVNPEKRRAESCELAVAARTAIWFIQFW